MLTLIIPNNYPKDLWMDWTYKNARRLAQEKGVSFYGASIKIYSYDKTCVLFKPSASEIFKYAMKYKG